MTPRKICVFSGTRADYGPLKNLLHVLQNDKRCELQLLITGSHLSPALGYTIEEVQQDGFAVSASIDILPVDENAFVASSRAIEGFSAALSKLSPDIIVILGDRYEALCAAYCALFLHIPVAHISGGEITQGAIDDSLRHAITKLSHLHFAATETYRNRIIQLGESPAHVWHVGEIGLDNLNGYPFIQRSELEIQLGLSLDKPFWIITYHPETQSSQTALEQITILLAALTKLDDYLIFTYANADPGGKIINESIDNFVEKHPSKSRAYASLGRLRYLSLMKLCSGVIGNSSSGIVEAPSLKVPTLNIGDRQKGRIVAASVVHTPIETGAIDLGIQQLLSEKIQVLLPDLHNPYYKDGKSAQTIAEILITTPLTNLFIKEFYDLPTSL